MPVTLPMIAINIDIKTINIYKEIVNWNTAKYILHETTMQMFSFMYFEFESSIHATLFLL